MSRSLGRSIGPCVANSRGDGTLGTHKTVEKVAATLVPLSTNAHNAPYIKRGPSEKRTFPHKYFPLNLTHPLPPQPLSLARRNLTHPGTLLLQEQDPPSGPFLPLTSMQKGRVPVLNPICRRQSYPLFMACSACLALPLITPMGEGSGAPPLMQSATSIQLPPTTLSIPGPAYMVSLTPW